MKKRQEIRLLPLLMQVISLCILVGANGAGKSSVLKSIAAVMTGIEVPQMKNNLSAELIKL